MSLVSTHRTRARRVDYRPPLTVIALTALLVLLAAGSLQGGITMVADPESPMGMALEHLEATPFVNYFWPGVFLLGIALASALTIPGLLLLWEWRWAWRIENLVGYEWPWISVMAIGILLFSFEVIALVFGQLSVTMHLLLVAVSLNTIGLALTDSARGYLAS
jgi:hypothetical protein